MNQLIALNARPVVVLLALIGLVFAGLCLANLLAFLLVHFLYGLSVSQFGQLDTLSPSLPHVREAVLLTQGVAGIGLGAGALVLPLLYEQAISRYFAPQPLTSAWWPLVASSLIICAVPLISVLTTWNASVHLPTNWQGLEQWARVTETQGQQLIQILTQFRSFSQLLVALLVMALIPAVAEELIFRGVMQRLVVRWLGSPHASIWLTAALFSALHVQFFGFVPRFLLGVLLGYLYAWSGNILVSIAAHFTQNAGQLLLLWLAQKGYIAVRFNPDALQAWPWPTVLVSSLLTTGIFYFLYQRFANRITKVKAIELSC
jgi:membrane protease YdiL (CAAX protease family)